MNNHKFDDGDRLKQVVQELTQQTPSSGAQKISEEDMQTLFEELSELVAVNAANNFNLCLMGGMVALLEIMVGYTNDLDDKGDSIRKQGCLLFNAVTGNNQKVQNFAAKAGAINLAAQMDREQTPAMREAILGSLSAFMKSANFTAKR